MRTLRLALLSLALTGITASSASADILSFKVTEGSDVFAEFGLVPFQVADGLRDVSNNEIGTALLVSGPLVDLDVDDVNGFTDYSYGAGTLTLDVPGFGTFVAPTLPFSFTVCEGCDSSFGGGLAFDFAILLGPGLFSDGLAELFNVGAHTLGGAMYFGLEDIDGDPLSNVRSGFDHRGFFPLEIVAVAPEPASLLLMLGATAGLLARRRRR